MLGARPRRDTRHPARAAVPASLPAAMCAMATTSGYAAAHSGSRSMPARVSLLRVAVDAMT
jgi:hypothetical protein